MPQLIHPYNSSVIHATFVSRLIISIDVSSVFNGNIGCIWTVGGGISSESDDVLNT
uniref:Uncharacterized protein n=1 Tax=Heterorhabditis bacteriophora TaxID=37862 RepID=A0A1I7XRS9_HETBA